MFSRTLMIGLLILNLTGFAHAAVLAQVGSKVIDDALIKSDFEQMNDQQRNVVNRDLTVRKTIVDSAINTELLYEAAKKAGLDKDKEYVQSLDRFKRQYLATKMLEKGVEGNVTSSNIKKYFDSNKNLFDSSQACALHIVVQTQEEAAKITALAKEKSAKFEELAKKYSIDPTVQENKGDLGCFTRDRMVPQFSDAAFSMKKDEVRGPVMTSYGYHVIKVYDKKAGEVPSFSEIEQKVKEAYRLKLMQETISGLRAKSDVRINEEELKKFKL